MKLIWTPEEMLEYFKQEREIIGAVAPFGPGASIRTSKASHLEASEESSVSGIITEAAFYFIPGLVGLVTAVFTLNDRMLSSPVCGDNQYIVIKLSEQIKKGDKVKALVRNYDLKYDHSILARVTVNPNVEEGGV